MQSSFFSNSIKASLLSARPARFPAFLLALALGPLLVAAPLAARQPEAAGDPTQLGDYYYERGEYDLARIEYERRMLGAPPGSETARDARARIGMSLIRKREYRPVFQYLNSQDDFSHNYLRMYAALRMGWVHQALVEQDRILARREAPAEQGERARLLAGLIHLEQARTSGARDHYAALQRDAETEEARRLSGQILTSLEKYESLDRKSPFLAASLSVALPGAGQVYSAAWADGMTAFFFNASFLGSAALLYDYERRTNSSHVASGVLGFIGLAFYLANIGGAYQAANRYNNFQERKFHQEIRDLIFHPGYIERSSGLEFRSRFDP